MKSPAQAVGFYPQLLRVPFFGPLFFQLSHFLCEPAADLQELSERSKTLIVSFGSRRRHTTPDPPVISSPEYAGFS